MCFRALAGLAGAGWVTELFSCSRSCPSLSVRLCAAKRSPLAIALGESTSIIGLPNLMNWINTTNKQVPRPLRQNPP